MKRFLQITLMAVMLIAFTGCIDDILNSRQYAAVNLTVIGRVNGAPKDVQVTTTTPASSYSTGSDGFVQLYAEFGQTELAFTVTFWTLPPSETRSQSFKVRLSNQAINKRVIIEDDPYRKIVPGQMGFSVETFDEAIQSWIPDSIILENGII